MAIIPVTDLVFTAKTALVRCDFNVPLEDGRVTDPARIDASLATIRYILDHGGKAVLCSHLGRPKDRTPSLSLKPVAEYLSAALSAKVALAPDCIGDITGRMITALAPGHAILLENLRFHPEEEANDRDFAHELARGKAVYVNDAFGCAHRAHASTVGVTRFIHERAAGMLMLAELRALRSLTENPPRPYIAILGGAKVSDKIGVIENLMPRVDELLIGGAMAYTFLKAEGLTVGRSLVEEGSLAHARDLMLKAHQRNLKLRLPCDHVVADKPDADAVARIVSEIPADQMGLDIGPRTVAEYIEALRQARTVVWNGPLGYYELPAFANGTIKVGEALAHLEGVTSLLGGGDTAAAFAHQPWARNFTHISTGGGATLEYLEGKELPGVAALES
ncbi:MAG: phosphoglycerate kinase [Candidatus Binataceae bacterium]